MGLRAIDKDEATIAASEKCTFFSLPGSCKIE